MLAGLLACTPWLLLAAGLVTLTFSLHPGVGLLAIPAVVAAYQRWARCGQLSSARAIVRLYRAPETSPGKAPWTIELRDRSRHQVRVLGSSRVTGSLAVLSLRAADGTCHGPLVLHGAFQHGAKIWITGNCDEAEFRRARIWLRLGSDDSPEPLFRALARRLPTKV